PTAAFYFLPSVIKDFNNYYPNIRIRILEHGANDCLESVLNGDADFGINMINITHSNISFTPLVNEPFILACPKDHELAKKTLISWDEEWKPNWFYEVRHLSTSLGMVEAGLGVAVVPKLA
ncbi:LysR family transcriptional regulator, partial [Klebsiella aerogenes]